MQPVKTYPVRDECGKIVRDKDGNMLTTTQKPVPFMGAPKFDDACFEEDKDE